MFELGGGTLSPQECHRIKAAIEAEAARIRSVTVNMGLPDFEFREDN